MGNSRFISSLCLATLLPWVVGCHLIAGYDEAVSSDVGVDGATNDGGATDTSQSPPLDVDVVTDVAIYADTVRDQSFDAATDLAADGAPALDLGVDASPVYWPRAFTGAYVPTAAAVESDLVVVVGTYKGVVSLDGQDYGAVAEEGMLFIAFDGAGRLLWHRKIVASDAEPADVVIGPARVCVVGRYLTSINFGVGDLLVKGPGHSGFAACLAASDGRTQWSVGVPSGSSRTSYATYARAAALRPNGDLVVAGNFRGLQYLDGQCVVPYSATLETLGASDGFVWRLDSAGICMAAAKLGSDYYDDGIGSLVPLANGVVVAGWAPAPIQLGTQSYGTHDENLFVARLDEALVVQAGNAFSVGMLSNPPPQLAVGPADEIYLTGRSIYDGLGACTIVSGSPQRSFVARLDATLGCDWAKVVIQPHDEPTMPLVAGLPSRVLVGGATEASQILGQSWTTKGGRDVYGFSLDSAWGTYGQDLTTEGGSGDDDLGALASDGKTQVVVAGRAAMADKIFDVEFIPPLTGALVHLMVR